MMTWAALKLQHHMRSVDNCKINVATRDSTQGAAYASGLTDWLAKYVATSGA